MNLHELIRHVTLNRISEFTLRINSEDFFKLTQGIDLQTKFHDRLITGLNLKAFTDDCFVAPHGIVHYFVAIDELQGTPEIISSKSITPKDYMNFLGEK